MPVTISRPGVVILSEVDLAQTLAGHPALEGGVGDAFGGEQAAVQQVAGKQVEAVVEGVDVGDDVQHAALVRAIPAAEELGEQSGGRR
jgi:hypothetical protein